MKTNLIREVVSIWSANRSVIQEPGKIRRWVSTFGRADESHVLSGFYIGDSPENINFGSVGRICKKINTFHLYNKNVQSTCKVTDVRIRVRVSSWSDSQVNILLCSDLL